MFRKKALIRFHFPGTFRIIPLSGGINQKRKCFLCCFNIFLNKSNNNISGFFRYRYGTLPSRPKLNLRKSLPLPLRFSDAVFAIAITLMIIEVKPPHLHHDATNRDALQELFRLTPMFFGVILSFIFIGTFWLRHHQLLKYLDAYNNKLLLLNLFFLLAIVFIPFSTGFVFENVAAHTIVPIIVYNINYIAAAFFNYLLFSYVLNPANGISTSASETGIKTHRFDLLYPIVVYLLVIVVSFFSVTMAPLFYAAFGLQRVFKKMFWKQAAADVAGQRI